MNDLPASKTFGKRDAYTMLVLAPLEQVTKSLLMGDAHTMETLQPFARRCRAVADAFDKRMAEINEVTE